MILGLAHIGLFIKDIDVSKKFYTENLGFCVASETTTVDGIKIAMIINGDCTIELVQLNGYENYQDGFFNHVAFKVDDIIASKAELEKKGILFETEEPVLMEAIFNNILYLMFRGPDGEHLEIDQML